MSEYNASDNLSQKHNNQGSMPRFFIDIYGVLVPLSVYLTTFVYGSTYGLMHRELFPDLFNINDDPFRNESYASHKLGMAPTIFFVLLFALVSALINAKLAHKHLCGKLTECGKKTYKFIYCSNSSMHMAVKSLVLAALIAMVFYQNTPYYNKAGKAWSFVHNSFLREFLVVIFYVTRSMFVLISLCRLFSELGQLGSSTIEEDGHSNNTALEEFAPTICGMFIAFVTSLFYTLGTAAEFDRVEPVAVGDVICVLNFIQLLLFNFYWNERYSVLDAYKVNGSQLNRKHIAWVFMTILSCMPAVIINFVGDSAGSHSYNIFFKIAVKCMWAVIVFSGVAGAQMNSMAAAQCVNDFSLLYTMPFSCFAAKYDGPVLDDTENSVSLASAKTNLLPVIS